MLQFAATLSAYVVLGTMAVAGLSHIAHLGRFKEALRDQNVWPTVLWSPLALSVAAIEITLGMLGFLTTLDATPLPPRFGFRLPFAGAAALLSGYGLYGVFLRLRRPGVTCACSAQSIPVTIWVVLRAGLLAALAATASLAPEAITRINADPARLSVVALASLAVGIAIWELPEALQYPTDALLSRTSTEVR
jgi:hypothetical protein